MGALSVNLLPLFAFFAPGFLFLLGFYGGGRLTRGLLDRGLLLDAAKLVLISALLNLIVAPLYVGLVDLVVDDSFQLYAVSLLGGERWRWFPFPWDAYLYIGGYLAVLLGVAGLAGYGAIRAIETRSDLPFVRFIGEKFTHQSLYGLVDGADSSFDTAFERAFARRSGVEDVDIVMAGVLTDTGPDERPVIYYGRVSKYVVSGVNTSESITLRNVEKLTLSIDERGARTPARARFVPVFDRSAARDEVEGRVKMEEFLLIEGRTIRNISFERFRFAIHVEDADDRDAAERLAAAARERLP